MLFCIDTDWSQGFILRGMSARQTYSIRQAVSGDLDAIEILLSHHRLPLDGVADHFGNFVVAVSSQRSFCGVAGLEQHGQYALLRSLAVVESSKGLGMGEALCRKVIAYARKRGLRQVYLLTKTARDFFQRRLGFRITARKYAPDAIRQSDEFRVCCPDSAALMVLDLTNP